MKYCVDCHREFFIHCSEKHREKKCFQKHHIETKATIYCKNHKTGCEYFCAKSDIFLCVVCINNDNVCDDHEVITISQTKEEAINVIESAVHEIKNDVSLEEVDDKLDKYATMKVAIQSHATKLRHDIDNNEKVLIDRVEKFEKTLREYKLSRSDDWMPKELEKIREEVLQGAPQYMVIMAALAIAKGPKRSTHLPDIMTRDLNYSSQDSIQVGELVTGLVKYQWHTTGDTIKGEDVVFTPDGNVVVYNYDDIDNNYRLLLLYDANSGQLILEQAWSAWRAALDPGEKAIVVCDCTETLTWLDEEHLDQKKT